MEVVEIVEQLEGEAGEELDVGIKQQ